MNCQQSEWHPLDDSDNLLERHRQSPIFAPAEFGSELIADIAEHNAFGPCEHIERVHHKHTLKASVGEQALKSTNERRAVCCIRGYFEAKLRL